MLGAQVTIEWYGQFMPVLGLVTLLYSYHGMMSVPTVKIIKPNSLSLTVNVQ